jgi:capsular exopolysaccharide synthesis family protein
LRTTVVFAGTNDPIRSLVVTSARPGEGKTMTAANLANAFAKTGARTLLISADLRRPAVERLVGLLESVPGISEWARTSLDDDAPTARVALQRMIRSTTEPDLFVLPAGHHGPNPAEVLASDEFRSLVGEAIEHFDMVVVDSPPVLPVADAAILAGICDAVIAVVSLRDAKRGDLEDLVGSIPVDHTRLIGFVLNKSTHARKTRYSYGYQYVTPSSPPDSYKVPSGRAAARSSARMDAKAAGRVASATSWRKAARPSVRVAAGTETGSRSASTRAGRLEDVVGVVERSMAPAVLDLTDSTSRPDGSGDPLHLHLAANEPWPPPNLGNDRH